MFRRGRATASGNATTRVNVTKFSSGTNDRRAPATSRGRDVTLFFLGRDGHNLYDGWTRLLLFYGDGDDGFRRGSIAATIELPFGQFTFVSGKRPPWTDSRTCRLRIYT